MNSVPHTLVTLKDIDDARVRLARHVDPTPLLCMWNGLALKAESLHPAGSFKIRGAFNRILSITADQCRRGVVAHSSGNHAIAVAYAAKALGVEAVVVMPENAPAAKRDRVGALGAAIEVVGDASNERARRALELSLSRGLQLIEPYDQLDIIAGTGTIGQEILSAHSSVSHIFAPVSGGGLIAGLASAIKLVRPAVKVIGVEPSVAADAYESFRAKKIVKLSSEQMNETIADGLRVQQLGALTWPHIRSFVDEIITVSEQDIKRMMLDIAREVRLLAEPSGAVAAAGALQYGGDQSSNVAILTGGNVDVLFYQQILSGVLSE